MGRVGQADQRPDDAADPSCLQRGDPVQHRFLRDHSDRRRERRREAEDHPDERRVARRRREPDHHDTGECQRAAEQQIRRGALLQEYCREGHDENRGDQHQHRGRPRIDAALGLVEENLVHAEPEQAGEHEERELAFRRADRGAREHHGAQQHAPDRETTQGERSGRKRTTGGPDADEGRGPQDDGNEGREERQMLRIHAQYDNCARALSDQCGEAVAPIEISAPSRLNDCTPTTVAMGAFALKYAAPAVRIVSRSAGR